MGIGPETGLGLWLGLAVLLGASGFIAYFGDALGRRIGRKRLTVFGLRPRHTAALFTVVTGMFIAGATLGVILLISEDIRERLLTYDDKVADVARLEGEKQLLEGSTATLRQQTDGARQATQLALSRQRAAQDEARHAERELEAAQDAVNKAGAALGEARTRLAKLQSERGRIEAAMRRATADLVGVRNDRAQAVSERDAANEETNRALEAANRITDTFNSLLDQVADANANLAAVQREYEQATERLDRARSDWRLMRERPVLAAAGAELARGRAINSAGLLREQLAAFAQRVNQAAHERGAAALPDPDLDGIYAVPLQPGEMQHDLYLTALYETVQRTFAEGARAVWLRAVAVFNTVQGQAVYYQVLIDEDKQLYAAGETIASVEIDGSLPPSQVIHSLQRLVQERVNPAVTTAGLLPNPDGRYTTVGPEVWYPALEQIRASGTAVRVVVVAARAIRTGDQLTVGFRIDDAD